VKRLALIFALSACAPDLGTPASQLSRARIIAVQAEPAEARPGDEVAFRALYVAPIGDPDASALSWSLCTAPKPLSENDTVARACLEDLGVLVTVGAGAVVAAAIPDDTCQRFGPDPPSQKPGDPPLRPRDADITGGYYQPLRIDEAEETTFALERIRCSLADASAAVVVDFAARYTANRNPSISSLVALSASTNQIPRDSDILLRLDYTSDSAEVFPVLDPESRALVDRRESLRASWFVSAGTLALDRSGRDGSETETYVENTWHTPTTPGPVSLWVVLRDSRGGVTWQTLALDVE